jgi:hypothetical protein
LEERGLVSRLSWASLRTAIAIGGLLFSAGAIAIACLDYAGEEVEQQCDDDAGDAGCRDAAAPVTTGGGSGS